MTTFTGEVAACDSFPHDPIENDAPAGGACVRASTRERVRATLAEFREACSAFGDGWRYGMSLVMPRQE